VKLAIPTGLEGSDFDNLIHCSGTDIVEPIGWPEVHVVKGSLQRCLIIGHALVKALNSVFLFKSDRKMGFLLLRLDEGKSPE
jgi:hypothetical protein